MVRKTIKVYQTLDGVAPFYNWLDRLKNKMTRARISRRLERLAEGNYGDFKSVGEGVLEMRLQFGSGYRFILQKLKIKLFCYY